MVVYLLVDTLDGKWWVIADIESFSNFCEGTPVLEATYYPKVYWKM